MIAMRVRHLLLPLMLAAGLGACASNAVQPGIVSTSAAPPGVPQGSVAGPAANAVPLGTGRVVSVREIAMQGGAPGPRSGGSGAVMTGGMLGAAGGSMAGALISQSVGGSIVGLVLGAVAGGIAGAIYDGQAGGVGRGIEVVVQRDDGQNVTIAQRDDGDVQLGDRVQIVQDQRGVARAVRDTSRNPD
jgi:outer membrane lipoprotein SlyB